MAGKRDIIRRIRATRNIQQITKAMKMVAAAKLRRAQQKVVSARPYAGNLQDMLLRLVGTDVSLKHPLTESRPVKRTAFVVISGDRGMAGSYNVNIIRRTAATLRGATSEIALIPVGRKGRDFFRRRGYSFAREVTGLGEEPGFAQARQVAQMLISMFLSGEVDEVRLLYTEFISALQQRPVDIYLLPIVPPPGQGGTEQTEQTAQTEYIYEPSADDVLGTLLPKYVEMQVYRSLLEAKASEQGARMTAMGSATDNASEMISKLSLAYNQARQAAITREISEIVGGAEALKG